MGFHKRYSRCGRNRKRKARRSCNRTSWSAGCCRPCVRRIYWSRRPHGACRSCDHAPRRSVHTSRRYKSRRVLILAGGAAGVAAAFNTNRGAHIRGPNRPGVRLRGSTGGQQSKPAVRTRLFCKTSTGVITGLACRRWLRCYRVLRARSGYRWYTGTEALTPQTALAIRPESQGWNTGRPVLTRSRRSLQH